MGQLGQLLDPDAAMAKDFNGRPCPEPVVLFEGQVAALAGGGVLGPDPGAGLGRQYGPAQFLPAGGEPLTGQGGPAGRQPGCRGFAFSGGGSEQHRQDRQPFAGPLVHPGLAAGHLLGMRDFFRADRAWRGPLRPPGRVVGRPLGDVQVERAHREQGPGRGRPRYRRPGTVCSGRCPSRFAGDPLLPARRHHRGQAQRADPGMVAFKVTPEQAAQCVRHGPQGRVVHRELVLLKVIHEQVTDRPASDAILADQLGGTELAPCGEHPHAGRRLRREHAGRAEQLIEIQSLAPRTLYHAHRAGQFQAVAGGDVAGSASFGGHDGGDPA